MLQFSKLEKNYIALEKILEEVKIQFENVEQFSYANVINSNFTKMDTISVFTVKWIDSLTNETLRKKDKLRLEKWLKFELDLDTLIVNRVN